ncbi:VgrG-related protein [Streptomyces physcomitrii]|uniref:VgrG-related protein n=1 Tax=Streptomyces physcomitrii TaxID=2724184 RepID=UPI0033D6B95A
MSTPAYSSIAVVTIDGRELTTDQKPLLTEAYVDQGVGVPAAFRLLFRDPYRRVLGELKVKFGSEVVITPVSDGKSTAGPLLTGEVCAMEADYDGTGSFAVIRGYDLGHRLMRRRRVAAYRQMKANTIATKLAGEARIPLGRVESTKAPAYEFISQSGVSDWDFLQRLADENEMALWVNARGKLQFAVPDKASGAPAPSAPGRKNRFELKAGIDILRLRSAVSGAEQYSKVEARGWDVAQKKKATTTLPVQPNPGISIGVTPTEASTKLRNTKLVETQTPYDSPAETRTAAKALDAEVSGSLAELEVVVRGAPWLRPGVPVTLADVGEPFAGKYTPTSVRHVFSEGRHYETWITVSGQQWRSLYGLASGGGDQALRLPGTVSALVTDVSDPKKQGRVKLQFPWLDDAYVSDWTRVVQWGGKRGGSIFPLDVGDEVLVGFDRGALDHPYVIGGLYNGKDDPTKVKEPLYAGARNKAARHTLSDREGNRMDLLSSPNGPAGKQGVRLSTGNDRLTINLDRAKTEITVDSKGTVAITGSRSVSITAGTDLTLKAGRTLTLRSGGMVNIQGTGMVNLRSLGGPVNVDAKGALSLKALGAVSVNGTGAVNVSAIGVLSLTSPNITMGAGLMSIVSTLTYKGKPLPPPIGP